MGWTEPSGDDCGIWNLTISIFRDFRMTWSVRAHYLGGTSSRGGETAMAHGKSGGQNQQLEVLWTTGTLTGLTDAQLLRRFRPGPRLHGRTGLPGAGAVAMDRWSLPSVARSCGIRMTSTTRSRRRSWSWFGRPARSGRESRSVPGSAASPTARPTGLVPRHRAIARPAAINSMRPRELRGEHGRVHGRSPAPALRRTGPAARPVPGSHRALPSRRQDPRAGRPTLEVAGRHAQRTPVAGPGTAAVPTLAARNYCTRGHLRRSLADRLSIRTSAAPLTASTVQAATRFASAQSVSHLGSFLDSRSLENDASPQACHGLRCSPRRRDLGRRHRRGTPDTFPGSATS